jgi:hypothetical protein
MTGLKPEEFAVLQVRFEVCWQRMGEVHVPRPRQGFQDLVAQVLFPDSIEYTLEFKL